jgi:AraC-like DNA-binding protein
MDIVERFSFVSIIVLFLFVVKLATSNQGNTLLNRLLALTLFCRAFQTLAFMLVATNRVNDYSMFALFFPVFLMLGGPAGYLYVRGFINDQIRLNKKDLLHLIPVALALINLLPILNTTSNIRTKIVGEIFTNAANKGGSFYYLFPIKYFIVVRTGLAMVYLAFGWKLYINKFGSSNSKVRTANKSWLFFFLAAFTVISVINMYFAVTFLTSNVPINIILSNSALVYTGIGCIYALMYYIISKPVALYGHLLYTPAQSVSMMEKVHIMPVAEQIATDKVAITHEVAEIPTTPKAEEQSLLAEAQIGSYLESLEQFVKKEKPYLEANLSMQELSQRVGIPIHHMSFVLNQCINKNFREYINEYRVQFFIDNYPSVCDKFTLEAMALLAGFRSKATFYNAFKAQKGVTPTRYFEDSALFSH